MMVGASPVTFTNDVHLPGATMLLALSGWMDGGSVSTGTVRNLMRGRALMEIATLNPATFYLDSFPGGMELATLLRPHVEYDGGLVKSFAMHANEVQGDAQDNIVFFVGKEPNLNWVGFADGVLDICKRVGVKRIIFMGSFGGTVPHTREPRLYGAVSEARLLPLLKQFSLRPTEYEGPASFATYLLTRCPAEGIEMLSISAEIPGYLEGANPLSMEAVTRRLSHVMNVPAALDELRKASAEWEAQVSDAVAKDNRLAKRIRKLEDEYDSELVDSLGIEE